MRHAIGLFSLLAVASFAHADPKKEDPKPVDPLAGKAFLAPIQVQSLELVPIVAATAPAKGADTGANLLVLDEAMAASKVKIKEAGDGEVNALTISNTAEQPVFLLAGEVIIGGKQDRIIGRNTIIPAKTTQAVPVFCVEHGRWTGSTKEFTSAKALAHGRLRGKASFEAQQDVWDEVAKKNGERKTESATGTYRKVATEQADGSLGGDWEKQVDAALAKVPAADRARMVGYAVAVNGEVASVDMFESPALFGKLEKKLLRSYVTEAVDVKAKAGAKAPDAGAVKTFMADADKAAQTKSYETDFADTSTNLGSVAGKSTVRYKAAPKKASGAADEAPAPTVFQNYSRH